MLSRHAQILFTWNGEYLTEEFRIKFLLFSGGYDGYRPPFANAPNSGYGQNQFNTPRDYSNGSYQRVWKVLSSIPPLIQQQFVTCFNFLVLHQDGYQQNYKRGTGQGPRGVSRGSTQVIRSWGGLSNDWLWLTCTTLKIQNSKSICPSWLRFFYSLISGVFTVS